MSPFGAIEDLNVMLRSFGRIAEKSAFPDQNSLPPFLMSGGGRSRMSISRGGPRPHAGARAHPLAAVRRAGGRGAPQPHHVIVPAPLQGEQESPMRWHVVAA